MPWTKYDDGFYDHPKVEQALDTALPRTFDDPEVAELVGLASVGLHLLANTYCGRHLTDGQIPARTIRRLAPRTGEDLVALLVEVGLFDKSPQGVSIHDHAHYNPSREEVLRSREEARERMRKRRIATQSSGERDANVQPNTEGTSQEVIRPRPDPTRTDLEGEANASPSNHREDVERLCRLFSETTRKRLEVPSSSSKYSVTEEWRRSMRLLLDKDGATELEVEKAIEWIDRHEFWSSNVLSVPTLRKQWERLKAQARRENGGAKRHEADRRIETRMALAQQLREAGE